MRAITIATLAMFAALPALAQTPPAHAHEKPVDKGPFTPQANAAYMGGGVILQGAPGAPAPTPEATPAGQTPRNAVPLK